jgi:hypothetical protein
VWVQLITVLPQTYDAHTYPSIYTMRMQVDPLVELVAHVFNCMLIWMHMRSIFSIMLPHAFMLCNCRFVEQLVGACD